MGFRATLNFRKFRSNDWSMKWLINWFLGCRSYWNKCYVRSLLNNTITEIFAMQDDSSRLKKAQRKFNKQTWFFCSFQCRPKSVKPASGKNLFFSLLKRVNSGSCLRIKVIVALNWSSFFSSSCTALSTAEAVKRNTRQTETIKPHTVVQFGQICSRKWTQIHYLKVSLSCRKMYSCTFKKDPQVSTWPSSQPVGLAIQWTRIRYPLLPLPGFVLR